MQYVFVLNIHLSAFICFLNQNLHKMHLYFEVDCVFNCVLCLIQGVQLKIIYA